MTRQFPWATIMIVAALAAPGGAAAHATPATPPHACVDVGPGPAQVAATVARPDQCCTGRMQCAQFLSTVRVVRPGGDQHT